MNRRVPSFPPSVRGFFDKLVLIAKGKDFSGWLRILSVLAYFERPDIPVEELAKLFQTSRRSVYRWVERYQQNGAESLLSNWGRTRSTSRNQQVRQLLPILLTFSPAFFGLARTTWCSSALAFVMRQSFALAVSSSSVRRELPKIGYSWTRVRPVPKRVEGREQRLADLAATLDALPSDVDVLFGDEVDFHLNPKLGFSWSLRGQQRRIRTPGTNQKAYVIGAVSARTGELWAQRVEQKTGACFFEYLDWLVEQKGSDKKWALVLDNASCHKGDRLRDWLEKHPLVMVLFLPGYSPDANPIELVWRSTKLATVYNHQMPSLERLMERVFQYFREHGPFLYRAEALPLNLASDEKQIETSRNNEINREQAVA